MSSKLQAMLSEVEGLIASASVVKAKAAKPVAKKPEAKKTSAASVHKCPECGSSNAHLDMSGSSCDDCGHSDKSEEIHASVACPECGEDTASDKCDHCGCEMKASTVKASDDDEALSYNPVFKQHLRKLKRMVDRGYLAPDELAGGIFEALRQARVSNRLAGAIANKVKLAVTDAEEDVIDVSARAKLAARARMAARNRK